MPAVLVFGKTNALRARHPSIDTSATTGSGKSLRRPKLCSHAKMLNHMTELDRLKPLAKTGTP